MVSGPGVLAITTPWSLSSVALQNVTELAYLIHSDERLSASCFFLCHKNRKQQLFLCASARPSPWPCLGGARPGKDPFLPTGMTPLWPETLGAAGSLHRHVTAHSVYVGD